MSKKMTLLVCAHKKDINTRNSGIYMAVQAGKALHPDLNLGYANDNEGDNISIKNPSYCELTVLYWGWKNIKDIDYCGLNHYRRYFKISDIDTVDRILNSGKYDMIVVNNLDNLSKHQRVNDLMVTTSQEDFYLFADTFLSLYPQFTDDFINYFYNSRKSYPFNMFIAKKSIYDDYCSFMFPVLFEFEKRCKEHGYTRQKRTIGYLGEYFLGLYVKCKRMNVKAVDVDNFAGQNNKSLKLFVKYIFYRLLDLTYRKPKKIIVPDAVKVGFIADGISLKKLK